MSAPFERSRYGQRPEPGGVLRAEKIVSRRRGRNELAGKHTDGRPGTAPLGA
jgi:hypothetical protein